MRRSKPIKRRVRPNAFRKTKRGISRKKADRLFSEVIRMRDKWRCRAKGYVIRYEEKDENGVLQQVEKVIDCSKVHQCAHIISRRYSAIRWSLLNAVDLCSAHHLFFTYRPVEWKVFIKDEFGDGYYESLENEALAISKPDLEQIITMLEAKHAELAA